MMLGLFCQFDFTGLSPEWLGCMLAFICLWVVELFFVQKATLISVQDSSERFLRWAPRLRLMLDVCFVVAVSMFLPRIVLVVVSLIVFLVHMGLISHYQYFLRPLSALSLFHNWREGVKTSGYTFGVRLTRLTWALLLIFGLKLVVLFAMPANSGVSPWFIHGIGLFALLGYLALAFVASYVDPLDKIRTTRGFGRLGVIRGYVITWLAECCYLGRHEVLAGAKRQREIVHDRLTPIETPVSVHRRLVIIQAESLDFNVLGYEVNGQQVTPFLNRLREQSLFYRIAAARYIGSADADFVMLSGVMPSTRIITYNIPNYPYENTLPQFLARYGYRTAAFHGNTGNFYNRRNAFEKMEFSEIHFREELVSCNGLQSRNWGVDDRDLLEFSARRLKATPEPVCHFIITLSTHTPYTLIPATEREVFAKPQSMAQDYLNNMRYLDNLLRDYLGGLKSATVVIYSDHSADPAVAPEFKPHWDGQQEFVPCFIYNTDEDLGAQQRTRGQPIATDGTLTLLDITTFLRGQVAAANGVALATSAASLNPITSQSAVPEIGKS
jgi:glucan phosphoethanolaminetransferase (alkaline phosphatase superfamily)